MSYEHDQRRAMDFYKEQIAELKDIIEVLQNPGSKDYEYIHPFDLCELINNAPPEKFLTFVITNKPLSDVVTFGGKKYRQSVHIKPKPKSIH
jgi:hypothetical protein